MKTRYDNAVDLENAGFWLEYEEDIAILYFRGEKVADLDNTHDPNWDDNVSLEDLGTLQEVCEEYEIDLQSIPHLK